LLVVGDALCSFNPLYGQGMSVAAMQVLALRETLAEGDHELARRFFRAAAKPTNLAWQLAIGGDLALPEVEGSRPVPLRVINAYLERVLTAAEHDPVLAVQFMRVANLIDSTDLPVPPRRTAACADRKLAEPHQANRGLVGRVVAPPAPDH